MNLTFDLIFLRFCLDVTDPVAEATTTWPDNTAADRCFVVQTTKRNFFLVAETVEEKK